MIRESTSKIASLTSRQVGVVRSARALEQGSVHMERLWGEQLFTAWQSCFPHETC